MRSSPGRIIAASILASTVGGCGGSTPSTPAAVLPPPVTRVFVSNQEWIDTFTVDASGALTPGSRLTPRPFIGAETVLSGRGARLYLLNLNGLEGFGIDPGTGQITPLPGSPFSTARGSLLPDPLDRFVWMAIPGGAKQAFRIDATTGALAPAGPPSVLSPFVTPTVEPEGRYAYGFEGPGRLFAFRIGASGDFTLAPGYPYELPPEGVNPGDLVFGAGAASSLFFFASQGDGIRESTLLAFRFDAATGASGALFALQAPPGRVVDGVQVSPSGAFLYVAYRNKFSTDERPGMVVAYAIDPASGRLTEASSVPTGRTFFSDMRLSPDGGLLLVTLEPSPFVQPIGLSDLIAFRVSGAALTPIAGGPHRLGPSPHTIHIFQTQPPAR